jgi:hypothetical protein
MAMLRCDIFRFILTQNQLKIYSVLDAAMQQKGVNNASQSEA